MLRELAERLHDAFGTTTIIRNILEQTKTDSIIAREMTDHFKLSQRTQHEGPRRFETYHPKFSRVFHADQLIKKICTLSGSKGGLKYLIKSSFSFEERGCHGLPNPISANRKIRKKQKKKKLGRSVRKNRETLKHWQISSAMMRKW